jgi:hypothetical protein
LANVASNVAPYPILMKLPYLSESAEPVRTRTAKKPAPATESVNYRDPSTPPPVRAPRPAPVVAPKVETSISADLESIIMSEEPVAAPRPVEKIGTPCVPVADAPRSEKMPVACEKTATPVASVSEKARTPGGPETHGKLVAFCLLMVIVGLCVHWHWASLAPYCESSRRMLNLIPAREPTEMVIVPADGAPMLAEQIAAPTPTPVPVAPEVCARGHDCPKPVETASTQPEPVQETKPPETTVAKPVEAMKPAETTVAAPAESVRVPYIKETTVLTDPEKCLPDPDKRPPEPQRLPDFILGTKPGEVVAKITLPVAPVPAESPRSVESPRPVVGPIVPVSATILKPTLVTPANYWVPAETPQTPAIDVNIKAGPFKAEVEFGSEILPSEEGSTP